jgi:hypothetical protein
MEYVIRLEDKRLYDALIGFLRTLGANAKGNVTEGSAKKSGAARFRGLLTESEAQRFDAHLERARGEWERGI